jgi:hypothetical protein
MTGQDLAAAVQLWGRLDEEQQKIARKGLAGRLRATGLYATLEWLRKHDADRIYREIMDALGIERPADGSPLPSTLTNRQMFLAERRALVLMEALHIYSRSQGGA